MELIGYDQSGNVKKASAIDFAKENAQDGESYAGIGQSPIHARYSRTDANGKVTYREVDLRELATQGGIKDVKFSMDLKKAQEAGLSHNQDVDSAIAYNIERIRSDDGRRQYLTNKGFKGVYNEGDNWYACENGMIKPLNNKDNELDWSDVARWAGTAGRDVGSLVGVAATGIGAAATGGTALAVAGAAGAIGGVAGELAQRGVDVLLGAEASKYQTASGTEEAVALAKTAGVGALAGAGGQLVNRGLGLLAKGSTQAVNTVTQKIGSEGAKEFTAKMAAKQEAGYLQSMLPTGKGFVAGSAEEAAAQNILKETLRPEKSAKAIRQGVNEAKEAIALGRTKPVVQDASEEAQQTALRNIQKTQTMQSEMKKKTAEQSDELFKSTRPERMEEYKQDAIARVEDAFGGSYSKEVETIFDPKVDLHEANKAALSIESDFIKQVNTAGVKIERLADGKYKIDQGSLQEMTTKKIKEEANEVGSYANSLARDGFSFASVPDVHDRALFAGQLKKAISGIEQTAEQMDGKSYKFINSSLKRTLNAINNHSEITHDDVAWSMLKFMEDSRTIANLDNIPPSVHTMIENANDLMYNYARQNSRSPMSLDAAYAAQSKSLNAIKMVREEFRGDTGGSETLFKQLADLSRVGGDSTGSKASEVASMWYLKAKEDGQSDVARKIFNEMNDVDRLRFSALDAVRNHQKIVVKKAMPKEKGESVVATMVKGAASAAAGAVAGPFGYAATATAGAAVGAALNKKTRQTVAKSLTKVGSVMVDAAKSRPSKIAIGQRTATAAEEYMANKLQNYTKSGHNKND